ncbi:hypothetical protein DL96DRAFT_1579748 [Flagelloscypha sp. PMI_526]|nr:hypothetical protein DL96DRAFT_1579748 [Flagelloscypha sp. PMI_526]
MPALFSRPPGLRTPFPTLAWYVVVTLLLFLLKSFTFFSFSAGFILQVYATSSLGFSCCRGSSCSPRFFCTPSHYRLCSTPNPPLL